MDWTDELPFKNRSECSFEANAMECDEHICSKEDYSCGDGQCVDWFVRMAFQRFLNPQEDCYTKRNLNYMCEVSPHRRAWTLEDGLCWPDANYNDSRYPPWDQMNSSQLTVNQKCQYLVRCDFSDGFEQDCPCNSHNCSQLMMKVCPLIGNFPLILYPPKNLVNPLFDFLYIVTEPLRNSHFVAFASNGSIRCRGYQLRTDEYRLSQADPTIISGPSVSKLLCQSSILSTRNYTSNYQLEEFCWNRTFTFNGRPYAVKPDLCNNPGDCVSQYRIRDGFGDCTSSEDEEMNFMEDYCTGNIQRHRFHCYDKEHKCLTLHAVGDWTIDCSNNYDERWFGIGNLFQTEHPCGKNHKIDCSRFRGYIEQSSMMNTSNNFTLIQSNQQNFELYCDSFWDMHEHTDELAHFCKHWICRKDQYQCQTGQCIQLDWVRDGEWDCADASDEEAMPPIETWSSHNTRLLLNLSYSLDLFNERYSRAPFSNICNISFELGCYLSKVSEPLDITRHRPCINLTQIGDGEEDCYNAYDERNTFEIPNQNVWNMWGFHSPCGLYPTVCENPSKNCTELLCLNHHDKSESCSGSHDVICLENRECKKNVRCDAKPDCSHGEDEYWCATGTTTDQIYYRWNKYARYSGKQSSVNLSPFPNNSNEQLLSRSILNSAIPSVSNAISYKCNRGIAVFHRNETFCFCPPAYYGRQCEFFADRISIIAYVDHKPLLKVKANITMTVRTNFLFENKLLDYHDFHLVPKWENKDKIKHKFYLLYSRSIEMIEHKQRRYFNRTDIAHHHPYSVHFDAFLFDENGKHGEIGSWHYPIYFDYLPAFRLAVVLKLPSWFGNIKTINSCSNNKCNENASCLPIYNQNHSYYCSCKDGYYGPNCTIYEQRCTGHCASNAFCRVNDDHSTNNSNRLSCICPPDRFGSRCHLKYDECHPNPCLNNGSCSVTYDRSGERPYICNCTERFYGSCCEHLKASVHVQLNTTNELSARATVVQLFDYTVPFTLIIQYQKVYHQFPSEIYYEHSDIRPPIIGLLKIYDEHFHWKYSLMYLQEQRTNKIISTPIECPHSSSLLSHSSIPPVFVYHQLCQNHTQRRCFHDQNYFCFCERENYRAVCSLYNFQLDHCDSCMAGGKCLQGDWKKVADFICLCPRCHQGHRCQFSTQAFGFALDSLIINDEKYVKIIYLTVLIVLVLIGLFNNLCSFITFKRPASRKVAVGNYLFIITCFNQLALFSLLFKFIQVIFQTTDVGSCKAISYLLSVFTRSTFWLTSWVTIERLFIVLSPFSSLLKNPRLAIIISTITCIVVFGMDVHEIICRTTIENLSMGSLICVSNFNTRFLSNYDRISTLIHYLVPFLIQIISITTLIILVARSQSKSKGKKTSFHQVLKQQFQMQKELYLTPTILIFSAIPQTILTFSFACAELATWQRHTLLWAYLLSYAPQVLGFVLYVLPSTGYKKEFSKTSIYKKLFQGS